MHPFRPVAIRRLLSLIAICLATIITIGAGPSGHEQASTTSTVHRDWTAFPAVVQMKGVKDDLYAIGDIHGDYEKAVKLIAGAKLIAGIPSEPKQVEWSGGRSILVCTGDMIDKGPQSLQVLQLMRALQLSADKVGGHVIVVLGNHEAEFLAGGGNNKKSIEFQQQLIAQSVNPADVAAGRDAEGIGNWLRTRPVAAKINSWFFCHAGNTLGMSIDKIEHSVESGIDKDGFGTFALSQPNSILQAPMGGVPWWMLGDALATTQPQLPPDLAGGAGGSIRIRMNLAVLGCSHLVVGHHPGKVSFGGNIERQAGEPFQYDGVLFLIDTGMSRGVQNGRGGILRIHSGVDEKATTIDDEGKESTLWSGR
jgi:hypothetical protein